MDYRNFLLLFSSIILSLIILELGVRTFYPVTLYDVHDPWHPDAVILHEINPRYGWVNVPNISTAQYGEDGAIKNITHNNIGLRMDNDVGDKTKPRIAIFGDSFVYGLGVDQYQTIPSYLKEEFPNYEILNFGVSGYSTDQSFRYLMDNIPSIQPDIVIFMIFNNDLPHTVTYTDSRPVSFFVKTNDSVQVHYRDWTPSTNSYSEMKATSWLQSQSQLYVLYHNWRSQKIMPRTDEVIPDDYVPYMITEEKESEVQKIHDTVCLFSIIINDRLRSRNIPYLIVRIPSREDVYEDHPEFITKHQDIIDLERPFRELQKCAKENRIQYLDLLSYLRLNRESSRLYYGHFTPQGNKLVSEKIATTIRS